MATAPNQSGPFMDGMRSSRRSRPVPNPLPAPLQRPLQTEQVFRRSSTVQIPQVSQPPEPDLNTKRINRQLRSVHPNRLHRWRTPLLVLAILTFVVGVALFAWLLIGNRNALKQVQDVSAAASPSGDPITATAGDDKVIPDETPQPAKVYTEYSVPADNPRTIRIEKLNEKGIVLKLGLLKSGNLDVPRSIYNAGWYEASSKPGEAGAALIVGHSTGPSKVGLFGRLGELNSGDKITIERGDGRLVNYRVVSKKTFATDKVDMVSAMVPVTPGKSGLNLMTCAGDYEGVREGYNQRLIVYTEQI
jgi:LPXTG-site transpeptidase (sortase) family protein